MKIFINFVEINITTYGIYFTSIHVCAIYFKSDISALQQESRNEQNDNRPTKISVMFRFNSCIDNAWLLVSISNATSASSCVLCFKNRKHVNPHSFHLNFLFRLRIHQPAQNAFHVKCTRIRIRFIRVNCAHMLPILWSTIAFEEFYSAS